MSARYAVAAYYIGFAGNSHNSQSVFQVVICYCLLHRTHDE
jgi:hypothetical protein